MSEKKNKTSSRNIIKAMDAFLLPATINPKPQPNNRKGGNGAPYLYNVNGGGSTDPRKNLGNTLMPISPLRNKADVGTWRDGIQELENAVLPYRLITQTLFRDVALDPQVAACLQKRYNLTLLREFAFVDSNGKTDKQWTKFFQKQWFKDVIRFVMDAQFYGYSLISLGDFVHGDMESSRYKKPVIITRTAISPERHCVSSVPTNPVGEDFLDPQYVDSHIWVPTLNIDGTASCGYGLFYVLGQETIKLRDMIGDNADYMQRYASPLLAMTTNATDETERNKREQAMNTNASLGWFMLDKDEKLEILNGNNGAGYKSYSDFEARIHKLISKIILLHSDAIDSVAGKLGSSQGGKESPAQSALYEVQQSDANFIEPVINDELLWRIQKEGIPLPEGLTFKFLNSEEENLLQSKQDDTNVKISTVAKNLIGTGFEIDAEWFEQNTGIKVNKVKPVAPPEDNF